MTRSSALYISLLATAAFTLTACGGPSSETEPKPVKVTPAVKAETAAPKAEVKAPEKPAATEVSAEEAMLKRGRIVWFKCRSCHELGVDGPHKVGPNLNGLIGAEAAKKEGFVYSKAFQESGIVWNDEALDAFITKPTAYVKGTKMAFVGIKKESDRKALIEYIRKESKAP